MMSVMLISMQQYVCVDVRGPYAKDALESYRETFSGKMIGMVIEFSCVENP